MESSETRPAAYQVTALDATRRTELNSCLNGPPGPRELKRHDHRP